MRLNIEKNLVRALAVAAAPLAFIAIVVTGVNAGGATTIRLETFQAAKVVIGQSNFTGDGSNDTAKTVDYPYGSASEGGGILFLPDFGNARVLGFKGIPSHNGAKAKFVLGQANLTSDSTGDGADQMVSPYSVVAYNGQLFVADFGNNRVLIWNKIPKKTATPADIVLGQTEFGANGASCGPSGMNSPETVSVAGGKLVVTDSYNFRVLIWNSIPTANGAPADLVLGQQNLSTCVSDNNGSGVSTGSPNVSDLGLPAGVWTDGTRLAVADYPNFRVLIWNTFPTADYQAADVVLGQPDFTSAAPDNNGSGASDSPSAQNFGGVYDGLFSNGTQLFVGDWSNSRVMVWNTFPTSDFQAADLVLGQPNFTCGVQNSATDGSCTEDANPNAKGFNDLEGIAQIGEKLIVSDQVNNRFMIFDQAPKK